MFTSVDSPRLDMPTLPLNVHPAISTLNGPSSTILAEFVNSQSNTFWYSPERTKLPEPANNAMRPLPLQVLTRLMQVAETTEPNPVRADRHVLVKMELPGQPDRAASKRIHDRLQRTRRIHSRHHKIRFRLHRLRLRRRHHKNVRHPPAATHNNRTIRTRPSTPGELGVQPPDRLPHLSVTREHAGSGDLRRPHPIPQIQHDRMDRPVMMRSP